MSLDFTQFLVNKLSLELMTPSNFMKFMAFIYLENNRNISSQAFESYVNSDLMYTFLYKSHPKVEDSVPSDPFKVIKQWKSKFESISSCPEPKT